MDPKLMEFIIDNNKALWHETEEERNTRYKKEEYNSTIIEKIKDIKLTDKQRKVMHLMFEKGLNYRETAKELGVIITTVQEIRDAAIKKIKKAIKYNFIA
jgi:RNA polymerase sigma factor (sigma-70 family)